MSAAVFRYSEKCVAPMVTIRGLSVSLTARAKSVVLKLFEITHHLIFF